MTKIFTKDIIDEFQLKLLNEDISDSLREITQSSINRSGLELAGVYESSHSEKNIIGWGTKENKWLGTLSEEDGIKAIKRALSPKTPLIFLSEGVNGNVLEWVKKIANEFKIPLVKLDFHLSYAMSTIGWWIASKLAPSINVHGSLVNIYGVGVMIIGPSGIGKSEAVLELIQNNHLFISDDSVIISRIGNQFVGKSASITKGYLEARGIGLIDIQHIYGAQIVSDSTNLDLVVELVSGEKMNELDRIGDQILFYDVLEGQIPKIKIPVNNGRSVSALIKAATSSFIAKKHGMDALIEIEKRSKNNG